MAVVFESHIKVNEEGKWFIELKDTVDNRVALCYDMDEYSKKIEDFGADYGGRIDEVKWSKDEDIHPSVMDEIRFEMSRQQEEIEKEKAEKEV
jgi:gas vesicle protein